jgi:hypothetical protein
MKYKTMHEVNTGKHSSIQYMIMHEVNTGKHSSIQYMIMLKVAKMAVTD